MASQSTPPPSSPPSWVILSALPRVGMLDNDADVSLLPLAAPPRVTLLTLAPRVLPSKVDPLKRLKLPFINATDPSGLLLAVSPPTPTRPPSTSDDDDDEVTSNEMFAPPRSSDYLVLDLRSATATRVPDTFSIAYNWSSLGVIATPTPAGAPPGFALVEFDHHVNSDEAMLSCFSSQIGYWVHRFVNNPLPPRISRFDDVISHDAKLWWVDSAAGLLACDPFAVDKRDIMFYVPLPVLPEQQEDDDDDQPDDRTSSYYYNYERKLRSRRRVQVSNGKFRCVDVIRARQAGQMGGTVVTMRTLADPETAQWTLEYEVRFDEISGLPLKKAPVLGFAHPENPDVLYFFVTKYLIGVDMRARKLVECQAHQPLTVGAVSPSSVLPFVLPPAFAAAGLPAEVSDNDAKEDESVAPPSDCQ